MLLKKKFTSAFISFVLCVCCLWAVWDFTLPISVYADAGMEESRAESLDYGSYIVTMLMSANCGITDVSFLNAVHDTFQTLGSSALAPDVEQALQTLTSNYPSYGQVITDIFQTSSSDAANYISQVGAENITNISQSAASAGANIWASAQNWIQTGVMAAGVGGMTLVSTVGPAVLAVAAGVGLGFLIDKARTTLASLIRNGFQIEQLATIDNLNPPMNGDMYILKNNRINADTIVWLLSDDTLIARYPISDTFDYITVGSKKRTNYARRTLNTDWRTGEYASGLFGTGSQNKNTYDLSSIPRFNTSTEAENYLQRFINGEIERPKKTSPSIVGTAGNQQVDGQGNASQIEQNYNPSTSTYQPIPWNKIIEWAQQANNNTQNGNTGAQQGQVFQTLVQPYVIEIPQPAPQPTPLPTPTEVPQPIPTIIPAPTIVPAVSPEPVPSLAPDQEPYTPTQPSITPVPSLAPEIQGELEEDLVPDTPTQDEGDPLPTVGLQNVFPFCIPWDIYTALTKFNVPRQAPRIQGKIDLGIAGEYDIDLDLSVFDNVAALLRILELIGFIIGLAIATNYLIGRN